MFISNTFNYICKVFHILYQYSSIHYIVINEEGVIRMATKSILKDVKIKNKQLAHTFIAALDQAENSKYRPSQLTRECKELTGDKIKDFFGKNK